mmetsp:Transcript_27080/g.56255  ORF Transcript_27080/g.56255 Transcript_27080/m.56255 type:complete len:268 (-) Transcript_27080:56-859(-)
MGPFAPPPANHTTVEHGRRARGGTDEHEHEEAPCCRTCLLPVGFADARPRSWQGRCRGAADQAGRCSWSSSCDLHPAFPLRPAACILLLLDPPGSSCRRILGSSSSPFSCISAPRVLLLLLLLLRLLVELVSAVAALAAADASPCSHASPASPAASAASFIRARQICVNLDPVSSAPSIASPVSPAVLPFTRTHPSKAVVFHDCRDDSSCQSSMLSFSMPSFDSCAFGDSGSLGSSSSRARFAPQDESDFGSVGDAAHLHLRQHPCT